MQSPAISIAIGAAALCGVAIFADRRRLRRTDPDRVGWVPWTAVQLLAMLTTLIAAALALRG